MVLDREKCVTNGAFCGLLMPGIAQMLAQRPKEGVLWLAATITAWWIVGPWALLVHLASSSRCARLMAYSCDLLLRRQPDAP